MQNYPLDQCMNLPSLEKEQYSTSEDYHLIDYLKFGSDDDIFQQSEQAIRIFSDPMPVDLYEPDVDNDSASLIQILPNRPPAEKSPSPIFSGSKKSKKNSNAIKKMGRIILSRLDKYVLGGQVNAGVEKMMKLLEERCSNKKSKCMVDRFNTYHLSALFDVKEEISRANLKTTRRIFTQTIRKEVLTSYQIKGQAKKIYLNTLKCSSLRFMSKRLANRLQNSDNPQ